MQVDGASKVFVRIIVGVFVCCEAGKSVALCIATLCRCDGAQCEAPFACFLFELAQVDPRLVGDWHAFPILDVVLIQAASCN